VSPTEDRDYTPAVYGSLLVTTLLTVELRATGSADAIALALLVAVSVFWLTHAWSRIVDRRVRGPVGPPAILALAAAEAPMLIPAVLPAAVLGLTRLGLYSADTALAVALVASLVQLFLWGLAAGRAAHNGWLVAVGVALVDLALGLLLVGLKIFVLH
jgi:hypothetical protein